MIKSVHFKNFKVLRDCTLPLGRFTLIVGPNGSGKSTAIQALQLLGRRIGADRELKSVGQPAEARVRIEAFWDNPFEGLTSFLEFASAGPRGPAHDMIWTTPDPSANMDRASRVNYILSGFRSYALDTDCIGENVLLKQSMELDAKGRGLAGVLDRLRDESPERFEDLNAELARWIPEFDRILFDVPAEGQRAIKLRTSNGGFPVAARELSQGTLLALAMLTVTHLPKPPPIVAFEEPDRGLHPRLLREVRDAMYHMAYPDSAEDRREPVQVIATTHSPYLLDQFRDHPDEIVIANKVEDEQGENVRFERLSEHPHLEEIIEDSHLGDVWYSGILGGVPSHK